MLAMATPKRISQPEGNLVPATSGLDAVGVSDEHGHNVSMSNDADSMVNHDDSVQWNGEASY